MVVHLTRRIMIIVALAAAGLAVAVAPSVAQETIVEVLEPAPTAVPTPIPATEIPAEAGKTNEKLREIAGRSKPQEDVITVQESLAKRTSKIEVLEADSAEQIAKRAARWSMDELEKRWLREETILVEWSQTLQDRAEMLEADLHEIRRIQDLWRLTIDSADEQELPAALQDTMHGVQKATAEARSVVNARRSEVLTLQAEVSMLSSRVAEGMVPVRNTIRAQSRSLLIPEQPPIWRTPWQPADEASLAERIRQARQNDLLSIKGYFYENAQQGAVQVGLFLVLLVTFWTLSRRAETLDDSDPSLHATTLLLRRPVASALLIAVLTEEWFHPTAPVAWSNLMGFLLVAALCRLLPPILPPHLRPGLIILVVLFLLFQIAEMVPQDVLHYRLALILVAAATGSALAWLIGHAGDIRHVRYPRWSAAAITGCRIAIILMVISVLADVIGSVDLAGILNYGVLASVFYAILLWTGTLVLGGAVAVSLQTPAALKLNMVRDHKATVQKTIGNAINLVAVALWIKYSLSAFVLSHQFRTTVTGAITAEFNAFGVSIRPLSIIPVVIVVYLTFKFSKLVRFIISNDVLPKFDLPRGVPNTILTITHYIILVIGFFFVVKMANIPLDKFTIIAGALSVGIGFGLQNVVNNFVSGLILLFERPISEGDKIQVGSISGQVKQIGIRASIVRTWQGAEVIVPNADLISSELVNWTLYDMRRRIEIPIGTAYGSDPETVMSLLRQVAVDHPDVLDDPEPSVPFMGFGDSSLNFEVRAWTVEDIVRVGSELSVAINRALAENGIEIPFPQRDIHMRSPDEAGDGAPQVPPPAPHGVDVKRPLPADGEGTSGPDMDLGEDDK